MAFKLPFFNKDSDTIDDVKAKGNALLNTAFGLGPLAFASYSTFNNIKSNNPNFLASAPTNQLGDIHSTVGESFSRFDLMRSQVRKVSKERLQKQFEDVDKFIAKLGNETAEAKTAFLANLKVVLSDPNIVDDLGALTNSVDKMLDEAFSGIDFTSTKQQELKDIITVIRDSNAGSDRLSKVAGYSSGAFSPVSDLLVRPQVVNYGSLKQGGGFSASAQFDSNPVVKMLRETFGNQVSFKFQTRQERVGNQVGDITYAQIFRRGDDRAIQTLPIQIGSEFRKNNMVPIRFGNMNTMYAGPAIYASAPALNELTSLGDGVARGAVLEDALTSMNRAVQTNGPIAANSLFLTPEMGIASIFARDVINRGGLSNVSSRDMSLINQNIQQSLEYIDRTLPSVGGAVNDFLEYKYRASAHRMALLNPMQMLGSERRNLRPTLSQHMSIFDFSASPFGQGNFGSSMGEIGLSSRAVMLASGQAAATGTGASVMESAKSLFGGLLTNRATQPITARFRQMHNREEFLFGSKPVGQGGPGTIAIMDVSGKSRFGLGEGTANYFGETTVIKPVNKPVYDPKSFGGSSNLLLEELKFRAEGHDGINKMLRIGKDQIDHGGTMRFVSTFEGSIDGRSIASLLGGDDGLIAKRGLKDSVHLDGNKLIYSSIEDFYRLFGDPKSSHGLYFGMIDSRRQTLERYSGIMGLEIGIGEVTSGRGFDKISIVGERAVNNPYMKIFSTLFKGTIESTDRATMAQSLMQRGGLSQNVTNRILSNLDNRSQFSGIFVSESSMLKKAPMNLAEQIGSSLQILGVGSLNKRSFSQQLEQEVFRNILPGFENLDGGMAKASSMFNERSVNEQSLELIESAIKLAARDIFSSGGGTYEDVGLTFGYFAKLYEKEGADIYGLKRDRFESLIKGAAELNGVELDMDLLEYNVSRGLAVGFTEIATGPQASTLGQNMGSMEPRLYNFLSYKLVNDLGVERKAAADFMFSMLSRKAGTAEEINLLKEYTKSMNSMSNRGLFEKEVKRISVNEFMNIDGEVAMREFLAAQDEGFMLDFSLNKDLEARVRTQGAHNLPSQVYIPAGENFLMNLEIQRTLIPGEEGFKEIDADYIRSLTRFSQGLNKVATAGVIKDSLQNITAFKESMAEFFGMSFRNVLRGKMQGSTFALGGAVDLGRFDDSYLGFTDGSKNVFTNRDGMLVFADNVSDTKKERIYQDIASDIDPEHFGRYRDALKAEDDEGAKRLINSFHITFDEMDAYRAKGLGSVNYTEDQKYLMRKIQRVVGGTAVFQDSNSFLNAMSTFMSGAASESTMERAVGGADAKQAFRQGRRDARKATANLMKHFFLGSHPGSSPNLANYSILGRHPQVGLSHIEFVRTFRDVREASGIDTVFQKFRMTEGGKKALAGFSALTGGKEFKGFNDLLLFTKNKFNADSVAGQRDLVDFLDYRSSQTQSGLELAIAESTDVDDIAKYNSELDKVKSMRSSISSYRGTGVMDDALGAGVTELRKDLTSNRGKLLNSLFMAMTYHMGDISSGVGGGRVAIPEMLTEVHYGGQKKVIDMSIASGMIGDFDGDIYQLLYPTRKSAAKIGLYGDSEKVRALNQGAMLYRAKTQVLFEMASDGIKSITKRMRSGNMDRSLIDQIKTHAMQEEIGKNVGPLDVSLDALRLGIVNTAEKGNLEVSRDVINLFSVVQEVANIKAKKLPDAIPLAQALSANINRLIENPGSERELATLEGYFRNFIFADQLDDQGNLFFKQVGVAGGGMDSMVRESIEGKSIINISDVMARIREVLPHTKEAGYIQQKTQRRASVTSLQENRAMLQVFQGMLENAAQSRIAGEVREDYLMSDIESVLGKVNGLLKRNAMEITSNGRMGAIGVGLAASMALGSAIGYGGYDATPLQVDGEYVSPELKAAIRDGSALNAGASPEDIENMQNSVHNDIMNRQINLGETMMLPGNNYNIRGQAINRRAINDLSQIVAGMGGTSHFTLNDTRSPISQHYINRTYFGD